MRRARWLVVGFVVLAALVGWVLNERGPFGDHPPLPYAQFLADWGAGRVDDAVQWRDRVEVTEGGRLLLVTVPPGRDLQADLAQASPGGSRWAEIPDNWLRLYTLWVPLLILVAAILLWTTAIARNRRADAGAG